jgi:hypothetical protein
LELAILSTLQVHQDYPFTFAVLAVFSTENYPFWYACKSTLDLFLISQDAFSSEVARA